MVFIMNYTNKTKKIDYQHFYNIFIIGMLK